MIYTIIKKNMRKMFKNLKFRLSFFELVFVQNKFLVWSTINRD